MDMTLDQIDVALPKLRKQLDDSTMNLLALVDTIAYKRLTGEGGFPKVALQGTTQAQAEPPLESFGELFLHRQLLEDKLTEAEQLRQNMPLLSKGDRVKQIADILTGPSIKLPPTQVPLEQRGLLSASEIQQAVTFNRMLEAMDKAFTEANRVVHAIDSAWKTLSAQLSSASSEIAELQKLAAALGETNAAELVAAQTKISGLQRLVNTDPLGVQQGFADDVEPLLAPARQKLNGLKSEHDQVDTNLKAARQQLATIAAEHDKGKESYRKRVEKVTIAGADKLPVPHEDKVIDDLTAWLGRLDSAFANGNWKAVSVGLVSFNAQAKARLEHAQDVFNSNQPPVEKRYELRGLLEALKAKAGNSGLAEDPEVSKLYQKAHELLFRRPTPLAEAETAVKAYQTAIS